MTNDELTTVVADYRLAQKDRVHISPDALGKLLDAVEAASVAKSETDTARSDDFKRGLDAAAYWHKSEAAYAKAIYCAMDRYSDDHEERASWRSYKDKADRHLYYAQAIRTIASRK